MKLDHGSFSQIVIMNNTNRQDVADKDILLPHNSPDLLEFDYLFHTHPNTHTNGGRVSSGVLYEFPSASDIYNFMKYNEEGKAQASLIVSPEGEYIIRPRRYGVRPTAGREQYDKLRDAIILIEKLAIKSKRDVLDKIQSDPELFHGKVSADTRFIKLYNRCLKPLELFVEYYPREKMGNEWVLRTVNLVHEEKR